MLHKESRVKVADNSGGLEALIFQVYKKFGHAEVGDLVRVAIKKAEPNMKVKKGDTYIAVIVRTVGKYRGKYKMSSNLDNAIVLLNNKKEPIGTHVNGYVADRLNLLGFQNIVQIADGVC